MLAAIENRLEELFESMETLPAEKIEAAEKVSPKAVRGYNIYGKIENTKISIHTKINVIQQVAQLGTTTFPPPDRPKRKRDVFARERRNLKSRDKLRRRGCAEHRREHRLTPRRE